MHSGWEVHGCLLYSVCMVVMDTISALCVLTRLQDGAGSVSIYTCAWRVCLFMYGCMGICMNECICICMYIQDGAGRVSLYMYMV